MAVRERQLGALGMRSNERGQVTAQCSLTQQVAELAEEAGAVCCICREGYKYQPSKVSDARASAAEGMKKIGRQSGFPKKKIRSEN